MSQEPEENIEPEIKTNKPITFKSALLQLKPVDGIVNYCIYCAEHYIETAPANELIACPNCGKEFRVLHPAK